MEVNGFNYDFKSAKDRLDKVIKKTDLIYSECFSKEFGNEVYIKPECLQITGSFKIRGAYNRIAKLDKSMLETGVVASSAGNHAQGVAFSAAKAGVKSLIVMPKTTPLIKVEGTESYGAEVLLYGDIYDEAYGKAVEIAENEGKVFVHPFNQEDVIEGQGTIGLEIMKELPDADIILVPIGGGGLVAGVAMAAKEINPNVKIIGVEPIGANAMLKSIDRGKIVSLKVVDTIADGVAVRTPGDLTYELVRRYVDEIVEVSDYDIMESFLLLFERHKIVAENAASTSVAALKKIDEKGKKIVCLVSGGNIDVVTVSTLINKGLIGRGRLFSFTVELPDTPGQLTKISEILARLRANVVGLEHNQFKATSRFMNVHLEITCETYGHEHINRIIETLEQETGLPVNKLY